MQTKPVSGSAFTFEVTGDGTASFQNVNLNCLSQKKRNYSLISITLNAGSVAPIFSFKRSFMC